MPNLKNGAITLSVVIVSLLIVYGAYGVVKSFYFYKGQYLMERQRSAKFNTLYLKGIEDNNKLRARVYDPIQMQNMRIRAKNSDLLYDGLHDAAFDLNACIVTISNVDDINGQYGIMLNRMRGNLERYENVVKATTIE